MSNLITFLAANQAIITDRETGAREFHSYSTKIAEVKDGQTFLAKKWEYSNTTTKYLCQFLGVNRKKDIETGIKNGLYLLADI